LPPEKKDINGEHGVMIKMMEGMHQENLNLARLNESALGVLAKRFEGHITDVKGKINTLSGVVNSFIRYAPCQEHSNTFKRIEQQSAGKTSWRTAVLICILGMVGLASAALIQWGRMMEAKEIFETHIHEYEQIKESLWMKKYQIGDGGIKD
jgi:hypothetical protein